MPVKIPPSLRPPTPATTVQQTKQIKQYGSLSRYEQAKKLQQTTTKQNQAINSFQEGLSYENYQQRYNQLPPELKKLVESPTQLFQSQQYKTYQSQQRESSAYNLAVQNLNRKAQGLRISWGDNDRARRIYVELLESDKAIRAAVESGGRLKAEAQRLGFGADIKEFQQAQQFTRPSDKLKPTLLEQELQMSIEDPIIRQRGQVVDVPLSGGQTLMPVQKPIGEVQPRPEFIERVKRKFISEREVRGKTFVGAGLGTLGGFGETVASRATLGDPALTELTRRTIEVAPFFTPIVGPALLIGEGAEGLTPRRRAIVRERFIERGLSPEVSTGLSIGIPIAEVGFGVFGLKGVGRAVSPSLRRRGEEIVTTLTKPRPPLDKRAEMGIFGPGKSRSAEQALAKFEKKKIELGEPTKLQAATEFKKQFRTEQIEIIRKSFSEKVYLDEVSLLKDLGKWKKFMRNAGLTEKQALDRLNDVLPEIRGNFNTQEVFIKLNKLKIKRPVQEGFQEPETVFGESSIFAGRGITGEITGVELPVTSTKGARSIFDRGLDRTGSIFGGRTRRGIEVESLTGLDIGVTSFSALSTGQIDRTETEQETQPIIFFDTSPISRTKQTEKPTTRFAPFLDVSFGQERRVGEEGGTIFRGPDKGEAKEEKKPTKPFKPIPFFFPGEREVARVQERVGYHAEVKVAGKFKKVTDKLHTREGAKDVMARVVDNTISAQGRIVPQKIKRQAPKKKEGVLSSFFSGGKDKGVKTKPIELQQGDGYFMLNQNKFRDYQIKDGRRTPLKNKWIEKKSKRLDTRGETQGLTVAQFTSRSKKRARGLPVRKRKGGIPRI